VDTLALESPHVKANLLLQAHFARLPMPIADYTTDTKSVLDQAVRILQVRALVARPLGSGDGALRGARPWTSIPTAVPAGGGWAGAGGRGR